MVLSLFEFDLRTKILFMKDSEFQSLPKEELLIVAKACRESAEGHFDVADRAESITPPPFSLEHLL